MGVGDSLDCSYPLLVSIPAGTWKFIGDGIVYGTTTSAHTMTMRFDVALRSGGDGGAASDVVIVSFQNTFATAAGASATALSYSASATGPALTVQRGDLLVLRVTGVSGDSGSTYYYDADTASYGGTSPRIILPQ